MKQWKMAALIGAVAAAAGWMSAICGQTYELNGVSDALYEDPYLYLMDNEGEQVNLFRTDDQREIHGEIDLPKLDRGWWNAYSHLTADRDGQVYVYQYGVSMEADETSSRVYRCDFDRGRLELVWELPPDRLMQIQVIDGALYFAAPSNEDFGAFYRCEQPDEAGIFNMEALYETGMPYEKMRNALYVPEENKAFWSDYNGRIYLNGELMQGGCIAENDHVHICLEPEGAVLTDLSSGKVEAVRDKAPEPALLFDCSQVQLKDLGLTYSDIIPFHYEFGIWTAGVNLTGDQRALGIFDMSGKRLMLAESLHRSPQKSMEKGILTGLLVFGAGLLLFWAGRRALDQLHGTVPVLAKLLSGVIPAVAAGSLILSGQMERDLRARIIHMEKDLLYALADQMLSDLDPEMMEQISIEDIPDDGLYRKLFGGPDYCLPDNRLYDPVLSRTDPVSVRTYQWLYLKEGDELKYAAADDTYYGARVDCYRDRSEMEKMQAAMRNGCAVGTEYNDQEGNWIALYMPVINARGECIGILESGMSIGVILYEVGNQIKRIHVLTGGLAAALTVIISVILTASLYPLSRLKHAVEETGKGNWGMVVSVRGRDEVAGISAAFNRMSITIREQMEWIQACARGYERFVPKQVFGILGRETVVDLSLGDQAELKAAVCAVSSRRFQTMARSMTGAEIYEMMNRSMKIMISAVMEKDGVIDRMADAGLVAFYTQGCEPALWCAVSLCEKMNFLTESGQPLPPFQIAITYGQIRIGIVGHEQRVAASTVSDQIPLAGFLQELGERFGARILITGAAAQQIPDFETRYRSRMIGYLYMKMTDSMEKIYDIYDGDELEQKVKKEKTSGLFAGAMAAFESGRYYDARQMFARILKENRDDLAAREYIYRCDRYYKQDESVPAHLWMDVYG